MSKHKVKTHRWNNGILETMEHFFDSIEESMLFAGNTDAHAVKIFNPAGEVVDARQSTVVPDQLRTTSTETYA